MAPPDLSDSFFQRWVNMAERLKVDPFHVMAVAFSESGCRAAAHNIHGDASGLIQFMPATLSTLGWTQGHAAFRKLDAADQVPFVERYFRSWAPWCTTPGLVYVATFLPAQLRAAHKVGPTYVLAAIGGPLEWAYKANTVLDRVKADGTAGQDGKIQVADLEEHLRKQCRGARWEAINFRLRQTMGLQPEPIPEPEPTRPDLANLNVMTPVGLQARLKQLGFDPGRIDGVVGPRTIGALRNFQLSRGLVVDGVVGPKTKAALEEV